jgi:hypothetical protein
MSWAPLTKKRFCHNQRIKAFYWWWKATTEVAVSWRTFPDFSFFFCTGLIRKSISLKDVHSKPLMEADDVSPWKWHTISAHLRAQRDLESGRQQRVCTSAG